MKQNQTSDFQRWTTVIQRRSSTLKQRCAKLYHKCFNEASMLLKLDRNQLAYYGLLNRLITFILLNEKMFFAIY